MSRPRLNPLFEIGDYWIGQEPNSPLLYRYWRDRNVGRTRRATLGTDDLEEAKIRLAEIVVRDSPATPESYLSTIFDKYCDEHGDKTATGTTARWTCRQYLECWGKNATASDVTEARQKQFAEWCSERKMAVSTIARHQEILRAALRYSGISIKVFSNQTHLKNAWRINTKAPRRVYIPTDAELRRLWAIDMPENLRRWILISLCTGCRPAAALDLSPSSRRREAGLIDLLPEGRVQNKKHRPVVRVPPVLAGALNRWERDKVKNEGGRYSGYANYAGVAQALERICVETKANIPALTTYSFRHKVATVLRAAKVPKEQRQAQLGHIAPGDRISDAYGEYDRDFLKESCQALETWVRGIVKPVRKR